MKRYITITTAIIAFFFINTANSSESHELIYGGRRINLPQYGINFVGFQHMKNVPKMPPRSGESWKDKETNKVTYAFDYKEMWRFDQTLGIWKSPQAVIRLGTINTAAAIDITPAKRGTDLTTKEIYDRWKDIEGPLNKWNKSNLKLWLETFCSTPLKAKTRKIKTLLYTLTEYHPKKNQNNQRIYVLDTKDTKHPRLAFHLLFDKQLKTNDMETISRVLNSISLTEPKKARIQRVSSRYALPKMTAKYLESRKQAISSVTDVKGWWYLESKNYIIVSNMKRKTTSFQLQRHLERSRKAYETIFPLNKPIEDISLVKLFNTRDEYITYAGPIGATSVGLWDASRSELLVSPRNWESTTQSARRGAESTTAHEGFHQFIYYAMNHRNPATWFNEGTACFFGGITFPRQNIFRIGFDQPRYTRFIQNLKRGNVNISKLINYNQQQYYGSNVHNNYALGWALMFYLYKGSIVMKQDRYQEIPFMHFDAMLQGKSAEEATSIAWAGIDMDLFNRDFAEFWNDNLMVARAKALSLKHHMTHSKKSKQRQVHRR